MKPAKFELLVFDLLNDAIDYFNNSGTPKGDFNVGHAAFQLAAAHITAVRDKLIEALND